MIEGAPLLRGAGAAGVLAIGATAAIAEDAGDALWAFFEARCLVPYEHILSPDTRDLIRGGADLFRDDTHTLIVTLDTCTAVGRADDDLGTRLAGRERYEEVAPGVWQSDRWREPRIEVLRDATGYTVRETDLES
ncbi:hypothetical protein ACK8OR_16645 [Jannaschia sp. KMU-145]|uniref:hypothetical protein n=1 Tax=Jannaschia halovivens TaxID=3388667 RepID=UPI00396B1717